jgi:hypothetical protein
VESLTTPAAAITVGEIVKSCGSGFSGVTSFRDFWFRWSAPVVRAGWVGLSELVWCEQVADGDRFFAAWAQPAGTDSTAPRVAVVAALFAEVAGVAAGAGVDGVGPGDDRLGRRRAAAAPCRLSAPCRTELLAALGLEAGPAEPAPCRRGVVAHGDRHAAASASWRSTSTPLWNVASARTRATRCGPFTARHRSWAASISL